MNRCGRLLIAMAVVAVVALPGVAAQAATPTPFLPTPAETSPTRTSPARTSPTRTSPTRTSPTRTRVTVRYTPPDRAGDRRKALAKAGQYLDGVAAKLGEPGIWVDSAVKSLDSTEIAELDQAAKAAGVPIRIAVIPARSISISPTGNSFSTSTKLAWEGEEIADQLYDRVGVEGVYAVLTHASSQSAGRGLHAVQRADKGPTYHVGSAVDQAVDCCSPTYDKMLARFVQRAQQVNKPFYVDAAPYAGGLAGLAALWAGGTALGARRARRADEKRNLEVARPVLNLEIIALSERIAVRPVSADPQQSKLLKDVLDTIEKARHRLDAAEGDADTEAVTTLLGSARYGIACLDAVRAGRPLPEPTPPCFFDPRHGPSTTDTDWAPDGGATRKVEICDECAARAAANQEPAVMMVTVRNTPRPYWSLGEELGSYIDGYWSQGDGRRWRYPDDEVRRAGDRMRARWRARRPGARMSSFGDNVGGALDSWASSRAGNSSGSSGWSGSSRRSHSSRTRSSGGGSSRRSSRRSGGSRGF
ncbi:hypothetical protein [Kribbella sp. CA-293567]|uniref:hypothetical protein n=1 Tax=Kribbella sp. CA-293567 TaxID=3002436 RepID=UPI0022DE690B|nr:hypothetical protein [Kribbella sp. CA-293567]WBQ06564.1 hypothetical protein OX958_07150 [Kribbella sp. CA-293567]